jgi:hypothetical protein
MSIVEMMETARVIAEAMEEPYTTAPWTWPTPTLHGCDPETKVGCLSLVRGAGRLWLALDGWRYRFDR